MQVINIPGVGTVQFPDEMSDEDIVVAAKRLSTEGLARDLSSSIDAGVPQPGVDPAEKTRVIEGSRNVPVTMLTGDPDTDRKMAENAWSRGATKELTPLDLAKVTGIVGGTALSGVGGIPAAMLSGGLLGGGMSQEETPGGTLLDAGKTALLAGGLSKAMGGVGRYATKRLAAAEAKAGEMAAKAVDKELNSLRGAYGGARQNESRAIEVLLRAESTGSLTPTEATKLAALKASPEWAETIRNVARNYMEDFPQLASTTTKAKGAFTTAAGRTAEATAEEQARVLSGGMAKEQIKARLKRYGPMGVAGALAGSTLGGAGGALLGGAAGAAVRPMIHALRRAYQHPAVQHAIWDPVAKAFVPAAVHTRQSLTPQLAAMVNAMLRRSPVGLAGAVADEEAP